MRSPTWIFYDVIVKPLLRSAPRKLRAQLLSPKKGHAPNFRPMSIVAKRSPISNTTELVFIHIQTSIHQLWEEACRWANQSPLGNTMRRGRSVIIGHDDDDLSTTISVNQNSQLLPLSSESETVHIRTPIPLFASQLPGIQLSALLLFIMVALQNRADHYIFILSFVMIALWNRAGHYIFALWFHFSFFLSSFFSSPNLSGRRLDVCHTSTHGVALVRI